MNNKKLIYIYISLTLLIMSFIFIQSAMPADLSNVESRSIVAVLMRYLDMDRSTLTFFVRKGAHFLEYLCLGAMLALISRSYRKQKEAAVPGGESRHRYLGDSQFYSDEQSPGRIENGYKNSECKEPFLRMILFMLPPWAAGTLFAVTDEIHQIYVSGRSCEFRDILIDSCGVALGVLLVRMTAGGRK